MKTTINILCKSLYLYLKKDMTTTTKGGGTAGNNGTLVLTTDVNGDGIEAYMPDGSEGPFN